MNGDAYDARTLAILKRRAERLAQANEDEQHREVVAEIALVAVGKERFGFPATELSGIVSAPEITRLRGLPSWMPGIAQVRGEVISVVDLLRWFDVEHDEEPATLVLTDLGPRSLGLLVSEVLGFRTVYSDELTQDYSGSQSDRPVWAMTNDLVAILDMQRLLASEALIVHGGVA